MPLRLRLSALFIGIILLLTGPVFVTEASAQEVDLAISKSGPETAAAGSDVTFTVVVTNTGPDAADTVTMDDPMPAGLTFVSAAQTSGPVFSCTSPPAGASSGNVTCTIPTLASGETAAFTIVLHIPAATPAGTSFTNLASVGTLTFDVNEENNQSPATVTTPLPPASDLLVQKTGPVSSAPDTDVAFTITIGNAGPYAAANATWQDALPDNLTFVSNTQLDGPSFGCQLPAVGSGGTVTCTIATLDAGATASFTLIGHVPSGTPSGTTYSNTATATTTTFDPNSENDSATATFHVSSADLSMVKAGPGSVSVGNTITWTITATNNGPDYAFDVTVTDSLPAGTTFESLTPNTPDLTCATPQVGTNGPVYCSVALGTGLTAGFTLVARVAETNPNGTVITNVASVTSSEYDANVSNNSASVPTTVSNTVVNQAPDAVNDTTSNVTEDSPQRTIPISALLGNDSAGPPSENGQTLTFALVTGSAMGGTVTSDASSVYFTPAADFTGAASFQYRITDNGLTNGSPDPKSDIATVSFTITEVNDAPTAVNDALSAVNEDSGQRTIPFAALTANDAKGPANESSQTLIVISVGSPVGGTVTISGTDVLFTPASGFHGAASFTYTAQDNGLTGLAADSKTSTATASFTITPVADTPTVTGAATTEDTQTTSGLVVTRHASDGGEVTHFKITSIPNGLLFQNDGTTPIANDAFITAAQGAAGLKFTPAANSIATGHFTVQASTSAADADLGGGTATADITVSPVADTPSVTNASTPVGTQTTAGLVITRNPADGAEVTHYKITGVTNGALFQADGTTPIASNAFITTAQGAAGLKFTPAAGLSSPGSTFGFDAQAAIAAADAGLGGALVHAEVAVGRLLSGTVVTSHTNPSTAGVAVTLTATVSNTSPDAAAHVPGPTPTGTVQFRNGPSNLGAPVPLAGGQATFTSSAFVPGSHSITAVYSGDVVYLASTSPVLTQSVTCQSMTVNPASLPRGNRTVPYPPVAFTHVGGIGAVAFTVTGDLPPGLTLTAGVLSGTPTSNGAFRFTVTATDANACTGSRSYLLVIDGPPTIRMTTGGGASNLESTTQFFQMDGTVADDGAVTGVSWSTDRGFSGNATVTLADVAGDDPTIRAESGTWSANIPLAPGANVVTCTATDNDGLQSSVQVTITVSTLTYYLAEGKTGPTFDTYLLLSNATATPAPVAITFFKQDGTSATLNTTVGATSRRTIHVDSLTGMADTEFGTQVVSTAGVPLSVERSSYWDAKYRAGHSATASDQLRTQWTLAEGSSQSLTTPEGLVPFFETYLLLSNPGPAPAIATIRFLLDDGTVVTAVEAVPATSRVTVPASALNLGEHAFGIEVTSTAPIAAARSMYFGPMMHGGSSSEAGTTAATWHYADAPTGPFYDSFLLLANPNATPATVTVTYYPEAGAPVTRIKTVGANSRLTVAIDAEDPSLANTVAWLKVASSIPIAAERAVFWPGPAGTWIESHGGNGSPDAGVHWTLAEGASGGPLGFESFLVIANPSASDAQVRVTYLRENGATVVKTYTVGALQRRTIHVNAAVPELVHEPFGADIRSTNGVPIVVERSMYWNAFQGGTSATATRVP